MDTKEFSATTGGRGIAVTEIDVDSFTRPGIHYTVRLYENGSTCNCRAATHGKGCTKHRHVAPALAKIRALSFGAERHEERLMDLAKRLYSKPGKGETAAQSMDLVYEVDAERFSTPALRRQSWLRHGIIVERCFGPEEAA